MSHTCCAFCYDAKGQNMDPPRCFLMPVSVLYSLVLKEPANSEALYRFATLGPEGLT